MNPEYDFEDLDDYVNGRMSDADRASFERALSTDPQLAEDVTALRAEKALRRLIREDQLQQQFDQWEPERQIPGSHRKWILGAGILIALFLGIIAIFQWSQPPAPPRPSEIPILPQTLDTIKAPEQQVQATPENIDYASLSKQFFHPANMDGTLMGDDAQGKKSSYDEAKAAFSKRLYQAALNLLLVPDSNFLHESIYLRAYSRYHLGQYALAEQDFRAFRNFAVSDFKYDAQWGEVFCLLRQLPNSNARNRIDILLHTLANDPDHPYFEESQKLLRELRKK